MDNTELKIPVSWSTSGSKPASQLVVAGPVTYHDENKLLRKVQITKPRNRRIMENEPRNEIPTYDLAQRLTNWTSAAQCAAPRGMFLLWTTMLPCPYCRKSSANWTSTWLAFKKHACVTPDKLCAMASITCGQAEQTVSTMQELDWLWTPSWRKPLHPGKLPLVAYSQRASFISRDTCQSSCVMPQLRPLMTPLKINSTTTYQWP